ncbi:helix-turn-helix domain-containing protein [Dongia sp.]|uniref:helix-turn-helix domain-containing protein n=1 Tax=Dongia sp. TaxID=1977262 RepID=UPI0035B08094
MKSFRLKPYKEHPQTLGEHLRKRRAELGIFQREAAARLGVNAWTYLGWEHDRKKPSVRMLPRIIDLLGYDPIAAEAGIAGVLKAKRRGLGLSQAAMALRLSLNEGTLRRYESGEWTPKGRRLSLIRLLIGLRSTRSSNS